MATASSNFPAPVGGLNDRDSLVDMGKSDAVILENWFPYPAQVGVRKGCTSWATGLPGTVETLVDYYPASGSPKLFAVSLGRLYDVSAKGAVGAPVVSGLLNNQWQDAAITTPGGSFLYLFNGVDKPLLYNGTTWISVDATSSTAITGVTTNLLVQGCLFKNRLWMVENNSLRAWYLPTNSIGGAASLFDLGSVFRKGGYLVAIYAWTIDAGDGADDHLVFCSSNGEFVVYSGTDPSAAATFNLVGVYTIGRPIGRRCGVKYGGDLLILTEEGLYPLSKALLSASIDKQVSITDKIQNGISQAVTQYRNNFGWIPILFHNMNMVILNVPAGNNQNFQYVQNTITGAWAKFTGWDAATWRDAINGLYFGGKGVVNLAWSSNLDNGNPIVADALPSFQSFGSSSQRKYITMVKPYLTTNGTPSIVYGLNIDYATSDVNGVFTYAPPSGMFWGSMYWGSMYWGGGLRSFTSWKTVGKWAQSAALRLKVQTNNSELYWQATDILYQKGGIL